MHKFRVVEVLLDGVVKFAPEYRTNGLVPTKKFKFRPDTYTKISTWKILHMIVEGTDEWKPCFYDTKDEAWNRIDTHKNNLILNDKEYTITAEYYD